MSPPVPPPDRETVELGRVVGVFGFRGEVKLHLDNPASDLLTRAFPVILVAPDGSRRDAELSARRGAGKRVIGRFGHVGDEAGARALQGARILARTADLPAPGDGEVYVWQLEDAEVLVGDAVVGRVTAVQGSGPVAVLEIDGGGREPWLVPLHEEFVVEARPGRVVLRPGALDEA